MIGGHAVPLDREWAAGDDAAMNPLIPRAALAGAGLLAVAPANPLRASGSAGGPGADVGRHPRVMNTGGLAWVNSLTNATGMVLTLNRALTGMVPG